jgi:hypothetical protein
MSLWSWITGRRGYRDAPDEPAATGGPPATVDSQDPLPEAQWFWRRCFIFVTTAVIIVGIWLMVQSIRDVTGDEPQLAVGAFVKIIGWMLLFQWFTSTYYLIAPSAEQVADGELAQIRAGVLFREDRHWPRRQHRQHANESRDGW